MATSSPSLSDLDGDVIDRVAHFLPSHPGLLSLRRTSRTMRQRASDVYARERTGFVRTHDDLASALALAGTGDTVLLEEGHHELCRRRTRSETARVAPSPAPLALAPPPFVRVVGVGTSGRCTLNRAEDEVRRTASDVDVGSDPEVWVWRTLYGGDRTVVVTLVNVRTTE
jgi:hypothetical protein